MLLTFSNVSKQPVKDEAQHKPEVPGGSDVEGVWPGDGLGIALLQVVVAQGHGQVPHQEWQEEEGEEQRGALVSHRCFPTELANMYFF